MNNLAYRIGSDDGINGFVAQPFEGWDNLSDTFAYLRGYYAGKKRKNFLNRLLTTQAPWPTIGA